LRPDCPGRIILVASGTGFAPMWSIAVAAIMEQPRRELIFVVATKTLQSFYMHAALCRLALFPNVKIIPIVSEPQKVSSAIRSGRPTDHLPRLAAEDVVYTAGAPTVTDTVARVAKAAGATCYTDPFLPNPRSEDDAGLMGRVAGWFDNSRRNAEMSRVA
jgi:3-phenylpropionate/trans-cinnamate dioxygenase ferredoxin reductase subunit